MSDALDTPVFDPILLDRYGGYGPRYTSYPTAVQFHEGFGPPEHRLAARQSNNDALPAPLSLYVHVPFCESPCFYCACNRVISRQHQLAGPFLAHLAKEIRLQGELFDQDRVVSHIHLGGGTPTWLDTAQLRQLMDTIRQHFTVSSAPDRQISIEIDPRTVDRPKLAELKELGFNRLSFGVQDLNPSVQAAVNRQQSTDSIEQVLSDARNLGFDSLAIDLIYGLPLQTPESFARTVEQIIAWAPDRLSVFNYAHMPAMFPGQRQIHEADLPSDMARLSMFQQATERLLAAGYRFIGLDHFAREDNELVQAANAGRLCRNFQGYSTEGHCDLIGLGPSAISHIGDSFSQNAKVLRDYYRRLDEERLPVVRGYQRNTDDRLRAAVIESIMCRGKVDFSAVEHAYELSMHRYFAEEWSQLEAMVNDGLITLGTQDLTVTSRGRLLLRSIASVFDAYMMEPNGQQQGPRFSRVV